LENPIKILIIDDDESISSVLRILLEDEGYAIDTAKNGREAIENSFANFYNLAIVDWRLPDVEGTVLLTKLRETTPKMVKIMLTGFPSMKNAVDSVNAKADAFLQKPVDAETLIKKIKDLLKYQEQERKYSEQRVAEFIQSRVQEVKRNVTFHCESNEPKAIVEHA
jgi:UDP-3-O-[3-hydroxymyristoyl] N-acetylglucosamine deacetylase